MFLGDRWFAACLGCLQTAEGLLYRVVPADQSFDEKSDYAGIFRYWNSFFFPYTHYSKSQIFVQKFNFDNTPTFSRVFHPKFFWQFFSWNQSCQQLKSPKPQHFHEFFTSKKSTIFSGIQSWIFGQKMKISNSVFRKAMQGVAVII